MSTWRRTAGARTARPDSRPAGANAKRSNKIHSEWRNQSHETRIKSWETGLCMSCLNIIDLVFICT